MILKKRNKGQVSIEMVIMLGILVLGAITLSVLLINSYNKNINQTDDVVKKKGVLVDDFLNDLNNTNPNNPNQAPSLNALVTAPVNNSYYNVGVNIPFIVNFDANVGNVNCDWTLSRVISGVDSVVDAFNGCNLTRQISASGTYTTSVVVTDDVDRLNLNPVNFTVVN